jgi:hypothetical protein
MFWAKVDFVSRITQSVSILKQKEYVQCFCTDLLFYSRLQSVDIITQPRSKLFVSFYVDMNISFFLWLYSPIQALSASMRLSFSLQLLDLEQSVGLLGRVISSSQNLYISINEIK